MFLLIDFFEPAELVDRIISIHLMFLLITVAEKLLRYSNYISIHLMFLLIEQESDMTGIMMHFNTSHVSINRLPLKM